VPVTPTQKNRFLRATLCLAYFVVFVWWNSMTVIQSDNRAPRFRGTGSGTGDIIICSLPYVCLAFCFVTIKIKRVPVAPLLILLLAFVAGGLIYSRL